MLLQHFYDEITGTLTWVLAEAPGGSAAVIDPILGFEHASGRTDTAGIDAIAAYLTRHQLSLVWILETHAHADHLSGAQILKDRFGGQVGIGAGIVAVQRHFEQVFALDADFVADGRVFDRLFDDGDTIRVGELHGKVLATPGHTSDSVSYQFGQHVFVGDSLFMPDFGTARCDFPGGDAAQLYDSIQRLLALPADTELHMCHDYPPAQREMRPSCTVAEQRDNNIHVGSGATREDFIARRTQRDATLAMPALIVPAIQVNIRAGALPGPSDNGVTYLQLPVDTL